MNATTSNARNTVRSAADEAVDDLKDAAATATDGLRQAAASLRDATSEATAHLSEAGTAAARGARDLWDQAGDAIRRNPMAAFGIALAAGAVLSRLLRR
jgi:ElaB/YqjD/DUF883 family membrane-anchored ribosome-binding protein